MDTTAATKEAFDQALGTAGLDKGKVDRVVATGTGRKDCAFADEEITEVGAAAKGAVNRLKSCRTVVDVGAEEGRTVRCDERGKVIDFAFNEKCAAGAGTFAEGMARALQVPLEELGPLSLKSQQAVQMNAQCAVFAESEVVTLIHNKTPREDIARAVLDAVASRIISMVRKVGFQKDIALIGGMALNPGFVEAMKRGLETDVHVLEDCEYIGALGAALAAAEASN
jgi:benzoyl-CoA reductase subunit D